MSDVKHLVFALDTFERVDTGTRERQALPKFTHCICKANVCAKVPSFVKGFVVGGKKKEQSTLVLKGTLRSHLLCSSNKEWERGRLDQPELRSRHISPVP